MAQDDPISFFSIVILSFLVVSGFLILIVTDLARSMSKESKENQ